MDLKKILQAKVEKFFDQFEFGIVKETEARDAKVPVMGEDEFAKWVADVILEKKKMSEGGMVTIKRADGSEDEIPGGVMGLIVQGRVGKEKKSARKAKKLSKRGEDEEPKKYRKPKMASGEKMKGSKRGWKKG
jgi:hypothetical protein